MLKLLLVLHSRDAVLMTVESGWKGALAKLEGAEGESKLAKTVWIKASANLTMTRRMRVDFVPKACLKRG
jgi:hypothetical protein